MLNIDEDAYFNVQLLPETKFIVTGVIGEGSCFFHSVFTSLYGDQYKDMSTDDREKYAEEYRKNLAASLTFERYINTPAAHYLYSNMLGKNLKKLWESDVIGKILREKYESLQAAINDMRISELPLVISDKFLSKFEGAIATIAKNLNKKCIKDSFAYLLKRIKDPNTFVDDDIISIAKNDFDTPQKLSAYNIIYIKKGKVYGIYRDACKDMQDNGKPYILLNYISETHYESIARIEGPEKVRRLFPADDPQIRHLLQKC